VYGVGRGALARSSMASLSLPPFAPDSFTISGPAWTNLTATWVTVLVITLRYCQASTNVERQYKYLDTLEDKISAELKDDELYRREGRAYKSEYSPFRWWIRRFYVIVLPVVAIIATGVLIYNEWAKLNYPLLGNIFDLVSASGVAVSFALYRIVPLASGAIDKLSERRQPPST
jgi:hypothetical protein